MRYRNVKTGQVVITAGAVTGENWVSDDPLNQQYEPEEDQAPEEDQEPMEAPKAPKGRSRSKKAAEE